MAESRVTQALIEAALAANDNARLTQEALEFLQRSTNNARVTQVALEIVVHIGGPPPPPPILSCQMASTGTVGVPYSSFIQLSGGSPPFTFSIIGGSLPPGLVLNTATGEIHGTPTTAGTYSYTVQVSDGNFQLAQNTCQIIIAAAPPACLTFELRRVYAMMRPHTRIPVRGS